MTNQQQITYTPQGGVCSQLITVEIENRVITRVEVLKGCAGNSKGVAALLKGMPVEEAILRLEGITCGSKNTSCPDQIAQALKTLDNPDNR